MAATRPFISQPLREEWVKSFARYLKTKRKRTRTSQRELAQRIGVSQPLISHLERGTYHNIPREMAAEIGEVFDEPQAALIAAGYLPFPGWTPC